MDIYTKLEFSFRTQQRKSVSMVFCVFNAAMLPPALITSATNKSAGGKIFLL